MIRETKVASIPDIRDDNVTEVLRAIKNVLEVREGHIGDALDQNATLRDLVDLSVLQSGGYTSLTGGKSVPVIPSFPPIDGYNPATDLTTPPAPTGLRAAGGFTNVYLEWDGAPYKNHAYAEIWRSQTDNLGTAILIGTTAANVYADPARPDTTYYYWIRFVSVANITGPYNQTSGTVAQTAIDVSSAIAAISENIKSSQLYIDLGSRIQKIDTSQLELQRYLSESVVAELNSTKSLLDNEVSKRGSAILRIDKTSATQATAITALGTRVGTAESNITSLFQTTATQATSLTSLTTRTGTAESNITGLQTTTASQASSLSSLTTRVGTSESNISTLQSTTATQATSLSSLTTRVGTTESSITTLQSTTASQASSISTLSSTVSGNTTSISTLTSTTNGLSGQYTVKIDNNGHVSGFGLASTSVNGTPSSAFIVRADRFAIAGPNDTTDPLGTLTPTKLPFIVTTSPTTIDGKTYPAGTWIDTAFVANATITTAQIRDLTADKITTGTLTAAIGITTGLISGGVNTAYSPGSANFGTGFYLGLDSSVFKFYVGSFSKNMLWDGTNLSIKGTISASNATFQGLTITDNLGNVLLSSGGIPASVVSGLGSLATQNSVSAGQVSGLGSLATQNSVSSGQVSGLGSLATQNSVFIGSNVQIYNGASYVTLNTGDFVNYLSKITSSTIVNFMGPSAITDAYIGNLSAAKITSGTISAGVLDSAVINAKVTNIDAAVIGSGIINNARIGDLSAKKIYCGNATNAVDFVDPGYTSVALRSHAVGYLYYSGDTGSTIYVPATCLDGDGNSYDCSYYSYGAAIIAGDSLKFKCVDAAWGVDRRVRTGVVQFFVTATATVDHYFSLWYRINGGSWTHMGLAIEQAGGYGTVGLQWSGSFTAVAGAHIEFGMSATDASLNYFNSSNRDIRYGAITVTAINF